MIKIDVVTRGQRFLQVKTGFGVQTYWLIAAGVVFVKLRGLMEKDTQRD